MADLKTALAGIGKSRPRRVGPPPLIKAIKQDLIKVNFDPSKASAQLTRLTPKTKSNSSLLLFPPGASKASLKRFESELGVDTDKTGSGSPPSRRPSLPGPFTGSSHLSLAASRTSSLVATSARRATSLTRRASSKSRLGHVSSSSSAAAAAAAASQARGGRFRSSVGGVKARADAVEGPPHGFRYHSNGDERVSRTNSMPGVGNGRIGSSLSHSARRIEKVTENFAQLVRFRERAMLKFPPRTRSEPAVRAISKVRIATDAQGNRLSLGAEQLRKKWSEPIMGAQEKVSGTHLASREGSNMFRQTILRHIRDMAQSGESTPGRGLARTTYSVTSAPSAVAVNGWSRWSSTPRVASDTGPRLGQVRQRGSAGARGGRGRFEDDQPCVLGDCLTPAANSSFNMRYGVPIKLMAQRKHILDAQHQRELEEAQKNDCQISDFLLSVRMMKEKSKLPLVGLHEEAATKTVADPISFL